MKVSPLMLVVLGAVIIFVVWWMRKQSDKALGLAASGPFLNTTPPTVADARIAPSVGASTSDIVPLGGLGAGSFIVDGAAITAALA